MIRCCIRNCDTDENVVNCTSVFFVSFPTDPALQNQWLSVLACNESLTDGIVKENTKICSCHFGDEAFGKHPIHGYRFLLPTAVPSVFPPQLESEGQTPGEDPDPDAVLQNLVDASDLVDDESNLISPSETIIFPSEPLAIDRDDNEPAEIATGSAISPSPATVQVNPTKTIGIQYANGKYYFLQSEDESEDELIEQADCQSGASITQEVTTSEEALNTSEDASVIDSEYEMIIKKEPDPNGDQLLSETESDLLLEEDVPIEAGSIIDRESVVTSSEFIDDSASITSNVQELIDVKKEIQTESLYFVEVLEEDPLAQRDDKSMISGYGTVEMLEETKASSSKNRSADQARKHFCQYCGKGFPYVSALNKHLFVHTGLKPHTCETCGKSFSQKVNLTVHLRRHTGEEPLKKFPCPVCEKKCLRLSELKVHIKSHWKKLPHACPLCTQRFSDITNYYDHIKSQHKNEMTLKECIDMIAQNENAELIVQGEQTQSVPADGRFTCTVCVKSFRTAKLLRKHKRKLHPKVYVCGYCPKQFLYKSQLDKHARVHTQERPFKCDQCAMAFSQKANLEVHLSKKHNICVKPGVQRCFVCEFCEKQFDRPSSLQAHIRTHTKERPFACRDCPKAFASNSSLAAHIRTHHRGESILLQSFARNPAAGDGSIILEENNAPSSIPEDGVKFIQYSIQFINPPKQEGSL